MEERVIFYCSLLLHETIHALRPKVATAMVFTLSSESAQLALMKV